MTQTYNHPLATTANIQDIVSNFSKQADFYDQASFVQQLAADRLSNMLSKRSKNLPTGDVLEIGCGTGLLSKHLITQFSDRQIFLLDPAKNMLKHCQYNLNNQLALPTASLPMPPIFIESTIESFLNNPQFLQTKLALIVTSFTLQWLADIESVIKRLINKLEIGGQLYFSYPIIGSFAEWQASCHELGLPFTANQTAGFSILNQLIDNSKASIYCEEYFHKVSYSHSLQFFRELKLLGAHTQKLKFSSIRKENAHQFNHLTVSDLRRITSTWNKQASKNGQLKLVTNTDDNSITCTYKIIEGIITVHG